jgi:2,5-diketo-D-gluconate reductase A
VSNFHPEHLDKLLASASVVPALNQVELHPGLGQSKIRAYDADKAIATEAWSPLARGQMSSQDAITEAAKRHSKTVSQVILRWHIQLGNLVIPKSSNPDRLAENLNVFDFELSAAEMAKIDLLESGHRIGPDPRTFS